MNSTRLIAMVPNKLGSRQETPLDASPRRTENRVMARWAVLRVAPIYTCRFTRALGRARPPAGPLDASRRRAPSAPSLRDCACELRRQAKLRSARGQAPRSEGAVRIAGGRRRRRDPSPGRRGRARRRSAARRHAACTSPFHVQQNAATLRLVLG